MKNQKLQLITTSPEKTQDIGFNLGLNASPGDIYYLIGHLGSGKTCLTQGIARGLDIKNIITSPTFVLIKEYYGRIPLYHIDLYRLEREEDILLLGLEQYFESNGLCVIEWAEKLVNIFDYDHLEIELSYISENERGLNFTAFSKHYENILEKIC